MTDWNLPPGCNVSDLPGWRPQDIARDNAFDRADADVLNKRYDSDDVTKALDKVMREDWKSLQDALSTDNDKAVNDLLSTALRYVLYEQVLGDA